NGNWLSVETNVPATRFRPWEAPGVLESAPQLFFRPVGAWSGSTFNPRLTPWAKFLRRFAAGAMAAVHFSAAFGVATQLVRAFPAVPSRTGEGARLPTNLSLSFSIFAGHPAIYLR